MKQDDSVHQTTPLLTVLIPSFNESAILPKTIRQLTHYLDTEKWSVGLGNEWEILIADDGSTDSTREVLSKLTENDSRVRYISYPVNAGQGRALQKGFEQARGEWIFCVDADLDYGPEHIESFMGVASETGAEIVVGSAYMRGGSVEGVPTTRYLMSRLMNWYFKTMLNSGISTYTSILRLYKRSTISKILLTTPDKDLLPEILIKAGLLGIPTVETPAHLRWKQNIVVEERRGGGVWNTARKAVKHLLWGAMENPLRFFVLPAALVGAGTLWFAIALLSLFVSALARSSASGLDAITQAASFVVHHDPQTVGIFVVLLQAFLVLLAIGVVVLQNKIKKDHDFIYFTQIFERLGDGMTNGTMKNER